MTTRLLRATLGAAILVTAWQPAPAGDPDNCLSIGAAKETGYIVAHDGMSTMCGNMIDMRREGDAIWFQIDDATWVVRDRALIAEAARLMQPVEELGAQQGALGAKQGRLGAKQGMLGAEQGKLAVKQASRALNGEASLPESTAERMKAIGEQMAALGRQQASLGEQQGELGARMSKEVEKAQAGLSELFQRALKDGSAVRVTRL